MWISKKKYKSELFDAKLDATRKSIQQEVVTSDLYKRIAELERQVKKLKKIVREGR